MFTAALFIKAKRWGKNPKYSSMERWIDEMWDYPYNGIFFSNKKK